MAKLIFFSSTLKHGAGGRDGISPGHIFIIIWAVLHFKVMLFKCHSKMINNRIMPQLKLYLADEMKSHFDDTGIMTTPSQG